MDRTLFQIALEEIENEKFANAISTLNKLIEQIPNDQEAYFFRSVCKKQIGDLKGALIDSEHDLTFNGDNEGALLNNIIINIVAGNGDKAKNAIERLLEIDPNHSGALMFYGLICNSEGRVEDALSLYSEAIESDPINYLARVWRGILYAQTNDKVNALADFEKINSTEPELVAFRKIGQGILNANIGDLTGALKYYDEAINADPKNPFAYLQRGLLKIELRDNSFEADLLKSTQVGGYSCLNIEVSQYWYIKSLMFNDLPRARRIANLFVEQNYSKSILWESLAGVELLSGDINSAMVSANKAINLDKNNQEAWLIRSVVNLLNKKTEEISKDIVTIEGIFGESPLLYQVGFLSNANNDEEGEKYLQKIIKKYPNDPSILTLQAAMLFADGKKNDSMELLKNAFSQGSTFTDYEMLEVFRAARLDNITTAVGNSSRPNYNTKERLRNIIEQEFKDKVEYGETVKGTIQLKLIERLYKKHKIRLDRNSLRTYLSRLGYSTQRADDSIEYGLNINMRNRKGVQFKD
jgi:tetratricopeptide (TPR) repeat protein